MSVLSLFLVVSGLYCNPLEQLHYKGPKFADNEDKVIWRSLKHIILHIIISFLFICLSIESFAGYRFTLKLDTSYSKEAQCDVIWLNYLYQPTQSSYISSNIDSFAASNLGRFVAHLSSSPFYYFLSALNDLLSNNCKHHSDVFRCFVCLACQVKNQYYHTFESWHLLSTSPSSHKECKYRMACFPFPLTTHQSFFKCRSCMFIFLCLTFLHAIRIYRNGPWRGQTFLNVHTELFAYCLLILHG